MKIQVCPIVLVRGVGKIKDSYSPIYPGGERYPQFRNSHLEEVQTVGDFFDSIKLNEDPYGIDRDKFIIWMNQPERTWCGGEVQYAIGIAKDSVSWSFDEYRASTVYISLTDDGRLVTAIPC